MYHLNSKHKPTAEEDTSNDIYIKIHVTFIKRNFTCENSQDYDSKLKFNSKVRAICKEMIDDVEKTGDKQAATETYANVISLYSRVIQEFKSISKSMKENLNEQKLLEIKEI